MCNQSKRIPNFPTEQNEREFWENHNSSEFIDWNNAMEVTFSNLKSSQDSPYDDEKEQDNDS